MKIVVAAICNNEAKMLPFFMRHYERFADKIVIFDDQSTDGALDRLKDHRLVSIYKFPRIIPTSFDYSRIWLFQRVIFENTFDADALILVDIDEHLYHPDIRTILEAEYRSGATFQPVHGFDIVSRPPIQDDGRLLCEQLQMGVYSERFSKYCVCFPRRKQIVKLGVGLHGARFFDKQKISNRNDIRLLHFHYVDERAVNERYLDRRKRLQGVNLIDAQKGIAIHHQIYDEETVASLFDELEPQAVNVVIEDGPLNEKEFTHRWWHAANERHYRWARAFYNWRLLIKIAAATRNPLKDQLQLS